MQTRDQMLATKVYGHVRELDGKPDKLRTSYGSMAHKLPVLIRTAGLAQALAFLETRDDEGERKLLAHLEQTLGVEAKQLAARSRSVELGEYMLLTRECLDALLWFKRFAQSVLPQETNAKVEPEGANDR